ncbi:hypothetical protein N7G274_009704 [Stereocaulon virgatum]|uniref:Uncharacterized protein n=1 Tax=Stereocaulon virgatum TaxID=373712 RepID=A0ABR3ZXY6_9LECA
MFNFGPEKAFNVRCFLAKDMYPIAEPADCSAAQRRVMHKAKIFSAEKYNEAKSWSVKSCGVLFGPESQEKTVEAKFLRWDIYKNVGDIIRICVDAKHGFRGGFVSMGYGEKMYRIIVVSRDLEKSTHSTLICGVPVFVAIAKTHPGNFSSPLPD